MNTMSAYFQENSGSNGNSPEPCKEQALTYNTKSKLQWHLGNQATLYQTIESGILRFLDLDTLLLKHPSKT